MSDMITRVGLAIARHIHKDADYGLDGDTAFEACREYFLGMGRAAIEAMRELTPQEKLPGVNAYLKRETSVRPVALLEAWQAIIDAALSQSPHSLPSEDR